MSPSDQGRPDRGSSLVDGTLYGVDPDDGGWVVLGSPDSIDPDSGTTPDEYLAAVREDVGGTTLRRITDGMTGLTTRQLDDGSTVYSGTVAAGLIARETGFKEGQSIRVLPFGYVAHDEAADPAAPLDVAVTVGADGVVREIAVTWGSGASPVELQGHLQRSRHDPGPDRPRERRTTAPRAPRQGSDETRHQVDTEARRCGAGAAGPAPLDEQAGLAARPAGRGALSLRAGQCKEGLSRLTETITWTG